MSKFVLTLLTLTACAASSRRSPPSQNQAIAAATNPAPAAIAPVDAPETFTLAVARDHVALTCGDDLRVEFDAGAVDVAALTDALIAHRNTCGTAAVVTLADEARFRDFVAVADAAGHAEIGIGIEVVGVAATRPAPPRSPASPAARPPTKLALPDSVHAVVDQTSILLHRADAVDQIAAALVVAPGAGEQVIIYASPDVSGRAIVTAVAGARHAGMPTVFFATRP